MTYMSKEEPNPNLLPKAKPKVEPLWKVEDKQWFAKAACQGADVSDLFGLPELEKGQEATPEDKKRDLRARNICTMYCHVREDCVIDGFLTNDTGIIRGGNRFVKGMGKSPCMMCGLPVAKPGRLCMYCVCKRYCVNCEREYATANPDDEPGLCPACDPEQNTSRVKRTAT